MFKTASSAALRAVIAGVAIAGAFPQVAGQDAGSIFLHSEPTVSIDLSTIGLGVVPLQGVPILHIGCNDDVILQQLNDVPPAGGTVKVRLIALFLRSRNAVTFLDRAVDVYITINQTKGMISPSTLPQPDALSPSTGDFSVFTDGTFSSYMTVNADVILVPAGRRPNSEVIAHQPVNGFVVSGKNLAWSAKAPATYPPIAKTLGNGFYPAALGSPEGSLISHWSLSLASCTIRPK